MKKYTIEISKESLDALLDPENLDKSNKFKGREEGNETRNKVLSNWYTFTKSRSDMKQTKWIMASYDHVLQLESDNTNCGVFACYFFKQLIKQDMRLLNNHFDVQDFRSEIKETIEENSKLGKK